jgi:hypothetical protein
MPTSALIMGGLGAVGSIGSSIIGSNAAQQASSQQVAAQQQVLKMLQQTIGPLITQGQGIAGSALPTLEKLLTPGPSQTATLSQLPGFQFAQQWGQTAAQNAGTAMGLGGNTLTAASNYATGLAQQAFGNYTGSLQSLAQSGLNLEGSAATALSGGSQSALSSIGNAQAAGTLGSANAISSGLTGTTSSLGNAALLYGISNKFGGGGGDIYGGQVANLTNTAIPTPA